MRLITFDETTQFELRILRYEFPRITQDRYDANWLIVEVVASNENGRFHGNDPCLTTWEVQELANWFDDVSQGQHENSKLTFIEPALQFHFVRDEVDVGNALRILIDHRWPNGQLTGVFTEDTHDIWIEFPLATVDLSRVAYQLRKQLERFPERP